MLDNVSENYSANFCILINLKTKGNIQVQIFTENGIISGSWNEWEKSQEDLWQTGTEEMTNKIWCRKQIILKRMLIQMETLNVLWVSF